ncbi:methyltransferase domain-containing protein [Alteromonas sp. CI.11.F.A3]|uniref:class I SAM-dependent methyltransferase n=1 Tax=unclassified Alteromonas TaxID=2614992 RepID=UPI001B39DCA5|nr:MULTISPECIES: methyltransferase domain-containing protein [unclassified Alteromonas]MBQ4830613.1 methyltransferase domain-containing protein [Alteromonas sp. MMG017]WOI39041.1 methyltransferase domain-containing protein [Alteromonas sp. CI.11.F.A3]
MRSAFRSQAPRYPEDWTDFPAGEQIKQAITQVCDDYTQRIFGYHFVKLGSLSAQIPLKQSPIRNIISQVPFSAMHVSNDNLSDSASSNAEGIEDAKHQHGKLSDAILSSTLSDSHTFSGKDSSVSPKIVGQSHQLPFSENSIDGFLLANELDFAQDPHEILREVDRVITQSGYVIISGFNPLSLAGIAKFLPVKRDNKLHDARFFTSYRIKDWLQLLGFEIVEQRQIMFSTLFFEQRWDYSKNIQHWLSAYLPWCSAMYVILARKRVMPMTAIRPKLQLKRQFSPVGAASARTSSYNKAKN